MSPLPSYILITPARNEEEFIESTILSVISQTYLPIKWLIVSDCSTDATEDIAKRYIADHSWIELIRAEEHQDRSFAAKARCFNEGYKRSAFLSFDIVGNLDADISFGPDYFEFLMRKFAADERLGVAGTPFLEGGQHYDFRYASIEHVSGACQLFRRRCFEEVGGYIPIREGGIDWVAVTTARMKGWKTRTFTEKACVHHRKIGTGDSGGLEALFRYGVKNYLLGGHPLWHVSRSVFQMTRRPLVVGGILLILGFLWASITHPRRVVDQELERFYRREQMMRLRTILSNVLNRRARARSRPSH